MGKEKRMIGDYTVLCSVNVGEKEVILASNEQSTDGEKFLCGFVERNIKDCLYSEMDMCEWYVDKYGDLRADAVHHDGTNHYLYRVYKDTATDSQIENLKSKIYDGKATRADITRVTRRLGDEIAAVYGFNIPRQKKNIERAR